MGRSHPEQRVNRVEAETAHSGSARERTACTHIGCDFGGSSQRIGEWNALTRKRVDIASWGFDPDA